MGHSPGMEQWFGVGSGIVGLLFGFLMLLLAVLWIALPFAVFGLKGRLDRLIKATEKTNEILQLRGPQ